ncbi:iron ABC transporter permease [Ktedonosporobacter rubrisoli]|uniref:Iron ABC transporter permease n=1 Tax=Ktedonosporobacter rubrisoli TaxID=2509675 RepID=A0A4P6K314_KTERU|nr:iron ABC transporter permease [Ktedonosporobacter rubrisoli]QBD82273.1 iron ABC transporter permease [Ktedonosporobacter rubrisoli]
MRTDSARSTYYFWLLLSGLGLALVGAIILSVATGAASLSFQHVCNILVSHLSQGKLAWQAIDPTEDSIVWTFRLPRVLLAGIVGAALAVSGTTLQALVRNPLADPYIFGISSGASVGAVAVLTLGPTLLIGLSFQASAFAGALITMLLVYLLAQQGGRVVPMRLLLAGIALGYTLQAVTSYLVLISSRPGGGVAGVLYWLAGSLATATWSDLGLPALLLFLITLLLILQARQLNALLMGEESATALGINLPRFRLQLFVLTSLLVGIAVSVSGAIGFVGLMLPHIIRFFVGANHRRLLPLVALGGALYLILVDLLGRLLIAPQELPVGIMTAILGGPFFLWLLSRRDKSAQKGDI